jgi:hypothetical protein
MVAGRWQGDSGLIMRYRNCSDNGAALAVTPAGVPGEDAVYST